MLEIRERWLASDSVISNLEKENEVLIYENQKLEEDKKVAKETLEKVVDDLKRGQEALKIAEQAFENEQ